MKKIFSRGLTLKRKGKERNGRGGQNRVLTENYFNLFKQEGIYRMVMVENIGKGGEDN